MPRPNGTSASSLLRSGQRLYRLYRPELFFGTKKVIWFIIRDGVSLKPFLGRRLYLRHLDFRNSRLSDFFLFFAIFLRQTGSSFVLSVLPPRDACRVLLGGKGRDRAG